MYNLEKNGVSFEQAKLTDEKLIKQIKDKGFTFPLKVKYVKSLERKVRDPEGVVHTKRPASISISLRGQYDGDKDLVRLYNQKTTDNNGVVSYTPTLHTLSVSETVADPKLAWFLVFCSVDVEGNAVDSIYKGKPKLMIYDKVKEARSEYYTRKLKTGLLAMCLIDDSSTDKEKESVRNLAAALGIMGTSYLTDQEVSNALSYKIEAMSNPELEVLKARMEAKNEDIYVRAMVQRLFDDSIVITTTYKGLKHIVSNKDDMQTKIVSNIPSHEDPKERLYQAFAEDTKLYEAYKAILEAS